MQAGLKLVAEMSLRIPVMMGEFAGIRRSSLTGDNLDLHLASRVYFLKYLTKKAKANGILPFYWDAGNMGVTRQRYSIDKTTQFMTSRRWMR